MHFSKSWWLRPVPLVISAWTAAALMSIAASAQDGTPSVARSDSPSTLQVLTQDDSNDEASGSPAGTAEVAGSSADRVSEQPAVPADDSLKPVPDPQYSGAAPVEAASFKGVTPGLTTVSEAQQLWGPPKEVGSRNAQLVHLYSVEPFKRVEVSFVRDKVAAIVIRLDRSFPADLVAKQLELSNIQPVLVSNELGEILGQSFPERGVMFAFEPSPAPGRASMKVLQIIIEPISAEPFVLRAETVIDSQPDLSARDLDQAVKLDPNHARAHWLRARLLVAGADPRSALEAVGEAVRLEPDDPQYRVTQAQILGQLGRFTDAIQEAQKAAADATKRPHVKARALCLLGDLLGSGPQPDFPRALDHHVEAIKLADPLSVSRHPAIRVAVKEVLIDAHLGAANDIAWGPWDQKEKAVPQWLDRAAALAGDMIETERGSVEHEYRVATRALAAYVGLRGRLDPAAWAKKTLDAGERLLASLPDSAQKQQARWDLGMALYDAVQICQMRGDYDAAIQYGEKAIEYLESGGEARAAGSSETYLLGRLYFRLGAIRALGHKDHAAAVDWFDKATPVLEKSATHAGNPELGLLGETFVSMAVSYWETDQRDRAIQLTERGIELAEQAVGRGALKRSALEVPYSNLATMLQQVGQTEQADKFFQAARKAKGSTLR